MPSLTSNWENSSGVIPCHLGGCPRRQIVAEGVRYSHREYFYVSKLCCSDIQTYTQCLSGRGDKDVEEISQLLRGKWADILDWHIVS
jgi:hypothetical protein